MKDDRTPVARIALLALSMVALLLPVSAAQAQETQAGVPPGWVVPTAPGLFAEPVLLKKLMNASDGSMTPGGDPKDGPYVELGNMITGAGWISAGPGYRRHVLNDRALVDASAAVSWNFYKVAQDRKSTR